MTAKPHGAEAPTSLEDTRNRILEALRGLRFGSVEVQVHDAQIVRITRTEKVRVETSHDELGNARSAGSVDR